MRARKLAYVLSCVGLFACNALWGFDALTDNGLDGGPLGDGAVDTDADDSAVGTDASVPDGSDSGMGSDTTMAADCKSATLHPPVIDAGPACPLVIGTAPSCPIGTAGAPAWCCKTSTGDGRCVNAAANPCMMTEVALECDDDTNCGGATPKCCGVGTVKQDPACAGTTAYFGSGFNSTMCQAICATGELHMCSNPAECAGGDAGLNCIPFKARGGQFGACQP